MGIGREKIVTFNSKKLRIDKIIDPNMIDETNISFKNGMSFAETKKIFSEDSITSQLK